ncbi:MAG: hypothetical protein WAM28_06180, partial [Chlamydiales bacterium]
SIQDQARAHVFSTLVIKLYRYLELEGEQHIVDRATNINDHTEPRNRGRSINPWIIDQDLKEKINNEPFFDIHNRPVRVEQDRILSLNLETMRTKGNRQPLTFKDLPERVDPNVFHTLFARMEEHINHLPPEEKTRRENYIQEVTGQTLAELKENILNKPTIPGLLAARGEPNDPVDPLVVNLNAIVKFILDQDDVDEALIRFSASAANCSTGQAEGIRSYYNNVLPISYHLQGHEQANADIENEIDAILYKAMQRELDRVFSDDQFLRQAANEAVVRQEAHQSTYLKNRLHQQVGAKHQLKLDEHTHCLYRHLLQKETQQLLKDFMDHFSIDNLIQEVKKGFAEAIANRKGKKEIGYSLLAELLEKYGPQATLSEKRYGWQEKYIEADDNYNVKGVTDLGARALLESAGYLQLEKILLI